DEKRRSRRRIRSCSRSRSHSRSHSCLVRRNSKPRNHPRRSRTRSRSSDSNVKSPANKRKKSPQRKKEAKRPRQKSPCRSHRRGSRSRSHSKKKRSRSRPPSPPPRVKSMTSCSSCSLQPSSISRTKTKSSTSGGRRSRRSRSRSASHGRRRPTYSQRDRWKREPSHSPVLILRKNRSPTRKLCSLSNSPQRVSELDKDQLLEIAKANAAAMCAKAGMPIPASLRSTVLPLVLPKEVKRKVAKQANSISIKEFTDKCKMIVDSKGELPVAMPHVSDEEDDGKPFGGSALREQKAISFSINNTTVRPAVRSDAGMAKEFPVSSGSQHRKKEGEALGAYGEWVPVDKALELEPDNDSVFPEQLLQPVDISQAVTERIKAQRRLAENPYDVNAICMLSRAQEQVDAWAQSNTVPGLFTGSTGAQILSSEELSTSGPQAWLKKV
uniref:SON DNA binding protein n=1 Tax=Gasterosteus aculeatus TaxID=69293 RepID=G3PRL9_GASAC